jgi:hypothetical protein
MGASTVFDGPCGNEHRKPILLIRVTVFTSFFSVARQHSRAQMTEFDLKRTLEFGLAQ